MLMPVTASGARWGGVAYQATKCYVAMLQHCEAHGGTLKMFCRSSAVPTKRSTPVRNIAHLCPTRQNSGAPACPYLRLDPRPGELQLQVGQAKPVDHKQASH